MHLYNLLEKYDKLTANNEKRVNDIRLEISIFLNNNLIPSIDLEALIKRYSLKNDPFLLFHLGHNSAAMFENYDLGLKAFYNCGEICERENNLESALISYRLARKCSISMESAEDECKALKKMAEIEFSSKNKIESMTYYSVLGQIYFNRLKDYQNSAKYTEISLGLALEVGEMFEAGLQYLRLGMCLNKLKKDPEKEENYFLSVLNLIPKENKAHKKALKYLYVR